MGLMDFVKKQFIDIIQWDSQEDGVLCYRYPMQDMEIQNGAQLVVRDSQIAIFVNEGKIADIFSAGTYTLNTKTMPIMTYLQNWDKAFESPFKSDVFFVSTKLQASRGWGTFQPVTVRDAEFGMVRVRAHGIYSYRVSDPKMFYAGIVGSMQEYTSDEIEGQLSGLIISNLSQSFADSNVPFLDMAANQIKMGQIVKDKLAPEFVKYGIELENFLIESISMPEELQKILDQRISMNVVGNLADYTKFQAASSLSVAAANPGGGMGADLGAGLAMGQVMAQALTQGLKTEQAPTTAQTQPATESSDDIMAKIEKLHGMSEKGIISKEEFEAKKAELLARL